MNAAISPPQSRSFVHRRLLKFGAALPALLGLLSCLSQSDKNEAYLALTDFNISIYDSVVVLVPKASGNPDTLLKGAPTQSRISKIPLPGYQGQKLFLVVEGYREGKQVFRKGIYYDEVKRGVDSTIVWIWPTTSVLISRSNWSGKMFVGDTLTLPNVSVAPNVLTNKTTLWISRNATIAKVVGASTIALKEGTVTLTTRLESDTVRQDSVFLQVLAKPGKGLPTLDSLRLVPDTLRVTAGGSPATFAVKFYPATLSALLRWESEDPLAATVSDSGSVQGYAAGATHVKATTLSPPIRTAGAWVLISSPVAPDSVRFTAGDSVVLYPGGAKLEVGVKVYPKATNQAYSLKLSEPSIAQLSGSQISGLETGKTVLVAASIAYPDFTDTLKVVVLPKVKVTGVTANPRALTWYTGAGDTIMQARVLPDSAPQSVVWRLSASGIVKLDSSGKLAALSPGKVLAFAISRADSTARDTITITAIKDAPILTVGRTDTTIVTGGTVQFLPVVTQAYGGIASFAWDLDGNGVWDDSAKSVSKSLSRKYSSPGSDSARFYARDSEGNETITVKRIKVVTGPAVVILSPLDGFITRDAILPVSWSIDNRIQAYRIIDTLKAQGPNTISRSAQDSAGIVNTAAVTVYWDTVPPPAPSVNAGNGASLQTPVWTWKSGDAVSGRFRFRLEDTAFAGAAFDTVTRYTPSANLSVGSHTLYVQERDSAGNLSALASKTVRVDSVYVADTNADLAALALSAGAFSPAFAAGTTVYTLVVANGITATTVTPTVAATGKSTVKVNGVAVVSGSASGSISLSVGVNSIAVVVTAESGATRTYSVNVTRSSAVQDTNPKLSALTLSAGTLSPAFMSTVVSYTESVGYSVTEITATPTVAATGKSVVKVNGWTVASGSASSPIALSIGANSISIFVAAESGATRTYTVNVTRAAVVDSNANLSALTLAACALSPAFTAAGLSYSAAVWGSVSSITVTPTVAATGKSTVKVNGVAVVSGSASGSIPLAGGVNSIVVGVTAESGLLKTYTVQVTRDTATVSKVVAGGHHTLFLKGDGALWVTGYNYYGQLGDGTTTNRASPYQLMAGVSSMAAGDFHTLILKSDGTLWVTGQNSSGQLGDGTTINRTSPYKLMAGVLSMAAGIGTTLILKSDSTLWVTGQNSSGQLGDGLSANRTSPYKLMAGVLGMAAGGYHTLILKSDGTLWVTGRNTEGQLGDSTTIGRKLPYQVMTGVSSMAAGGYHTLILKNDGTLWVTGNDTYGALGDGTATDRKSPYQLMPGVSNIAAGYGHSLILKSDGTLLATGSNTYGQIGDGTTATRTSPYQLMSGVSRITAGYGHSLILKSDGTLWATGNNDYGQLGDGTTTQRLTPVQIMP